MKSEKPKKRDPDLEKVAAALEKASKEARRTAAQTKTKVVVMRDGKLVSKIPQLEPEDEE